MPVNSAFSHGSKLSPKLLLDAEFFVNCWFALRKIKNNHNNSSFYVFALLVTYFTYDVLGKSRRCRNHENAVNVWILKDLKGSSRGLHEEINWRITSEMKYHFKYILDLQNTVWRSHSVFGLHLAMGPWNRILSNYRSFTLLRNSWPFFGFQKFITNSRRDRRWFYKEAHEPNPHNSPF
jgi:hypothetical protein